MSVVTNSPRSGGFFDTVAQANEEMMLQIYRASLYWVVCLLIAIRKTKTEAYCIRCIIVVAELVDQELADNGRRFSIVKPHTGYSLQQTLQLRVSFTRVESRGNYLSDEVFREVAEIVRTRDVSVCEEVLIRVFWIITVA